MIETFVLRGNSPLPLNDDLKTFGQDLQEDALARRRLEIAIVTFGKGGCQTLQDFTRAGQFAGPMLVRGPKEWVILSN